MSDEHHHHGHDDDHDHHAHDAHDHSHDVQPALRSLLWSQIEFQKISTMNESVRDAGMKVVQKTWTERLNPSPALVSDADEQLLMMIPFSGTVKLHSILIRSSETGSAPKTLKLFSNRNDMDFAAAEDQESTQALDLAQTQELQEIPVKRRLFGNTYCLTLFFEDNYGAEATEIFYLGFKGDFTKLNRDPVEVLYEKAANPKDHAPIVGVGGLASQGPRSSM